MRKLLTQILVGLLFVGLAEASAYAVVVNEQNQVFAQSGEKITLTFVSGSSAHREGICNVFLPTAQVSIDPQKDPAGKTVNLGPFSAKTEMIFQLLDPVMGFRFFNDPRNNLDLENHIRITDLGHGKFRIGCRLSATNENYDDLVFLLQAEGTSQGSAAKKTAASSWRLYE